MREYFRRVVAGLLCMCIAGAAILLASITITAGAKDFSGGTPRFDPAKLSYFVLFPGISEPVRVSTMMGVAGLDPGYPEMKLPDDVVDKLIRARDRNALWLTCMGREDCSSIAYTYIFANNAGQSTRIQQVEGPYDRGVYFKVPSEYLLFHSDLSKWEYRNEDGYFKLIAAPLPLPKDPIHDRSNIPSFINWAEPILVCRSREYSDERMLLTMWLRMDAKFINGSELCFDEKSLKLVKEIITEPTALADGTGWDYSKPVAVREIKYIYDDPRIGEREYPVRVEVSDKGLEALRMEFKLVEGFWMLDRGLLYRYGPNGERDPAFGFNTANILIKR